MVCVVGDAIGDLIRIMATNRVRDRTEVEVSVVPVVVNRDGNDDNNNNNYCRLSEISSSAPQLL